MQQKIEMSDGYMGSYEEIIKFVDEAREIYPDCQRVSIEAHPGVIGLGQITITLEVGTQSYY